MCLLAFVRPAILERLAPLEAQITKLATFEVTETDIPSTDFNGSDYIRNRASYRIVPFIESLSFTRVLSVSVGYELEPCCYFAAFHSSSVAGDF